MAANPLHIPRIRPLMDWKEHNLNRLLTVGTLAFWGVLIWWVKS
jgi:hypothetical protein